jgi:CRISPR-associated endonuclease/helicase Cas3
MTQAASAFDEQFVALTGYKPLRWQRRLFDRFVDGDIPTSLDLPTGLGKTSAMAIWLIAQAQGARLPRRLVYVVDRRAVVDQATEEAERLRIALEGGARLFETLDERARTKAKQLAATLKERLGLSERKLSISTLRGAHVDNRDWLNDPTAPAIIVGTVDMIGSRLLFEGYGVSRNMRPYHSGLIGADTLVVLDEAHLVPPFEALLQSIVGGTAEFGPRLDSDRELVPPFRLLSLSATGRTRAPIPDGGAEETTFRLKWEDLSDPVVEKRLAAKKAVSFVKIGDDKDGLVEALAQNAWKLSGGGSKRVRSLVYCDSREIAERAKEAIETLAKGNRKDGIAKVEVDTELFVGARRVREREIAKDWLRYHGFLAGADSPEKPAFLIATSAGEVGVDLDADHMVCDLVPWERMVQRLGRVNRRGEGEATIVVAHGDEPQPKKHDAPTDPEKRQAIGFRSLAILEKLPTLGGGRDAGPGALRELKLRAVTDMALAEMIEKATTPEPLRPVLTRATVDAWSMTSLENHTGRPDVAPWLRGWVDDERQTTVIWRARLPVRQGSADWPRHSVEKKKIEGFFEAAPPHESEKLETETHRVVEWLQSRANRLLDREGPPSEDRGERKDSRIEIEADENAAMGEAEAPSAARPAEKLGRDDLVAFALTPDGSYGAHYSLGVLTQERKGKAKEDFHDELVGKILVIDARFGGLAHGLLKEQADERPPTADASDDWSREAGFRVRLSRLAEEEGEGSWRFEAEFALRRDENGDPVERLIVEHFRDGAQNEEARSISKPQELAEHQNWAERKARRIAATIGLSDTGTNALALAALLHDEGKKAPRWQRAFRAPREKDEGGTDKVFAKTRGPINPAILCGYRHEFGSLPYLEKNVEFQALPEDWRDLVLHLVAAHHGQARPIIRTQGCEDAPPSAVKERACDVALRFARLQKRWGPWGLARWEALLRAADQQASRENDAAGEATGPGTETI